MFGPTSPADWQSSLRAEVEAAVRQRMAEGWPLLDALRLVTAVVLDQVAGAAADGITDGLRERR